MIAAVVGGSLLPTVNAASASRNPLHVTKAHSARPSLVGAIEKPVRGLPHDGFATVGAVPFAAAPPKHRKHGSATLPGTSAGIPTAAIDAYEHAQGVLSRTDPSCRLSWEDVAGIGTVESDNGQTWGAAARVTANGTLFPAIFGIPLNGLNGTPAMPARGGWVRAEGPMQFLPATWTEYAQDGNNDGSRNPQNFYDAALTTGVFLCANGGNLAVGPGLTAAILAYNHSGAYATLVESWISFYKRVGLRALTAAGSGMLPTAAAPSTRKRAKQAVPVKPQSPPAPAPSPTTLFTTAALSSQATGAYSFSLSALAGSSKLASGSGTVDTRNQTGSLVLQVPGLGSLQMRLVGGQIYVLLPPALASPVGANGWIVMTTIALSRMPAPFASALSVASKDLTWLVGQLAGATAMRVAGTGRINGAAATEFSGRANLLLAGSRLPGSSTNLREVAALVGSADLGMSAWVSGDRIQSAVISLGGFLAGAPVSLHLAFMNYGRPVKVVAPAVSPLSSPTTTTTTTSSTTTTTTVR